MMILHSNYPSEIINDLDFAEVSKEFVRILHDDQCHRYLREQVNLSIESRVSFELRCRLRQGWDIFHKHRSTLLNRDISLQRRLKLFDTYVIPYIYILFGLCILSMTKDNLRKLDIIQRKILRYINGGRRLHGQSWKSIMSRMTSRLEVGHYLHYCQSWSICFARAQWKYIIHLLEPYTLLWTRQLLKFNFDPQDDQKRPYQSSRRRGYPRRRWDDYIKDFYLHQ